MNELSRIGYEKAKVYILSKARELELSRFVFIFENGSKESVIEQLKIYQNDDGGFGHGIEPDFWSPYSTPMATWAAGQILMEIGAGKNDPIVRSMISYLLNTVNTETGMWNPILPENNNFPHAPWWHWHEGVQENWSFNPSVELAAFLVHWSDEQSDAAEIGWGTIDKAVSHLMNKKEMDRHEINNYQQFLIIIKPQEAIFNSRNPISFENVYERILIIAEKSVDKDVSAWSEGYKALPLDFIDHPDHPLRERLGALVDQNLLMYIEQMSEEGIWDISWNWGIYPEEYEIARGYWKGILAVNRYKQLRAFGYLE
ncbi:hypothetical protein [Bacillus sp. ISL-45]|uniref:hypothetical protein n=1 Tax=Bacillus sp. ISL-45 TaxID=2819128 RepID=UPI001BEA3CBA|nr:hypothetical protein [Bacillus sp. ISL-45]MBT2663399.1 hypothetical protein [Bacillus sp. ISL-45]